MVNERKRLFEILLVIFLLSILIPSSFALDNDDVNELNSDVNHQIESVSNEDVTPLEVDYYFNGSADNDGDGSINNPYKDLTTSRLREGSTIHLANGEYELSAGRSLNKVTIIGEDAGSTVIKYTGSSIGKFTVDAESYVTLQNVTFDGFNFDIEGSTFQATNTVFKNSVAVPTESSATDLVNSATNSFGGTIYAYYYSGYYDTYYPLVVLENCTFINNTAEYGGAICMNKGSLDIVDSLFMDNYAFNYGGAIAGLYDVSVKVKNSRFINDYSVSDAGGAIYLLGSFLSASNVSFVNCSSTFGPAVTSLNSTVALSGIQAINNTAKYEGGAIYQMYNAVTITDSYFYNNSARNGGALFIDGVQILTLTFNNFENNTAQNTAGAVYLLANSNVNVKNNTYITNRAYKNDDLYQTDSISLRIGSGNYTLYYNNYTFDGNLPSYYSLIDEGYVTSVKNQQSGGNCWAFSAIAALESAILKASGDNLDLSEENVKNLMQLYSDYGWSLYETNNGGLDEMSLGYFASWLGPVLEYGEEYDDYSMLSPVLDSITHVQNVIYLGRSTYTDNDAIKEAVIKYGAVSTGIYYDSLYFSSGKNAYYYYGGNAYANHAVAIVGWDDSYSRNNFYYKPAGDGAWIVKNSWDDDWGDGGYFYVSYYDTIFAQIGVPDASFAFVFNDTVRFDKNYQYDILGKTDYLITNGTTVWVENIFNATDNELLAGVSTYFRKNTEWELFVYINDQLALSQNGTSTLGYVTINLDEQIPVSAGDIFKIVFKFTSDSHVEFAISESISANKEFYHPGVSFISEDGLNWTDLYDYSFDTEYDGGHSYLSQVAAIKAFTILYELQPSIDLTYTANDNSVYISSVIYDQYGNLVRSGKVIFNIEGVDYIVNITNSFANFSYTFVDTGIYDVNVTYRNANSNISFNITGINIGLCLNIGIDKNNADIDFTSELNVTVMLNVTVNDDIYSVLLEDGRGSLKLDDLDFGYWNVSAIVDDDYYTGGYDSGFNVTISKTVLVCDNLIAYHNIETSYSISLMDIYGNPVADRQVSFILDGKSHVAVTDSNGVARIENISLLKENAYKLSVLFYGDESYFASSATPEIEVKSTIIFENPDSYLAGSDFNITLFDQKGSNAFKSQVNVIVDGVNYWFITDANGLVSQKLTVSPGRHEITVNNLDTSESVTQVVNVVSRLMENKNVNMYFGAGSFYQVRVFGDDGNAVGAGEIVKITFNGKSYNVKTDNNGYARFKISVNPKTYTLTATYKGVKVSNKIVVKKVLTAKNISKKKSKTIKFSAKLVNTKGNAVKGKKITFKVKGKTYKVKTNAKGVATIKIKNLKVGKYTVTTKYGKSTLKNSIRIKK